MGSEDQFHTQTERLQKIMIRKVCISAAVMAAVFAGTAGVANAATPTAPTAGHRGCTTVAGVVNCTIGGVGGLLGGDHRGGRDGGFRGGNFGGRGGFYPGGFYRGLNGNVLSYSQLVSSCGCGGDTIPAGYVLVSDPQVVEVPVQAVEAGDGSCATSLSYTSFGRLGGLRGGWHRH
jgi:hypothetical protein